MVRKNRRLGRNVFGSILLLAIFSCTLFSGTAFCEEAAEAVLTQAETDYAQAETLYKSGKFAEAKALYEYVPQNSSDSNLKHWAQFQVLRCDILLGDPSLVAQSIKKLKDGYSGEIDLYSTIYGLAGQCRELKEIDKARDLYKYVSLNSPDSNSAFMGQTRVVGCEQKLGNYSVADQEIEVLKSIHFKHKYQILEISYAAKRYYELNMYHKARELFEYVSQNSSDSKLSLRAHDDVARCSGKMRKNCTVEQAIAMLSEENITAEVFVDKVLSISNVFIHKNDPAMALPYINSALQSTTDIKKVIKLLRLKAECYIDMGAKEQAEEVQQEIALYSSEEGYFGVQRVLADKYREKGDYEKSFGLYQQTIENDPNQNQQLLARRGFAKSSIHLGNDAMVEEQLDMICANHPDHKQLPYTVYVIGEEHFIIAEKLRAEKNNTQAEMHYQKAIGIWKKRIIDSMPGCNHEAYAYLFSGISHKRLKQYSKASECLKKVIQDWPDYHQIHNALTWYASCLRVMPKKGLVTPKETTLLAEDVFGGFIKKNPDHTYANLSLRLLGDSYCLQSQYGDAIDCYERLIDKDINLLKDVHAKYCESLEALGRDDTAKEVRRVLVELQQQEK